VGTACHLFPHPVQQNARAWRVKQKPHGPRGAPSTESQQNTKIRAAPPRSLGLLRSAWDIKQELVGRLILINRGEKVYVLDVTLVPVFLVPLGLQVVAKDGWACGAALGVPNSTKKLRTMGIARQISSPVVASITGEKSPWGPPYHPLCATVEYMEFRWST
jgi:hypothetical protein